MSYHDWSDNAFDWKSLNAAEEDLTTFCLRWARLGGQSKEKFGELRFYAAFGCSIHSLLLPGYHHYAWFPQWLISFDNAVFTPFVAKTGIAYAWMAWQRFIYKTGYRRIMKKYPHIRDEIAGGADYPEYFCAYTTYSINEEGQKVTTLYHTDNTVLGTYVEF